MNSQVMNQTPPNGDDESLDCQLGTLVRSAPMPAPEAALDARVRQIVRLRRICHVGVRSVALLLVSVLGWQVIARTKRAEPEVATLGPEELQSLFAPPPVDPLAVLNRRHELSLRALDRWKGEQE